MTVRCFEKKDSLQVAKLFRNIVSNLEYYNDLAKEHEIDRYSEKKIIEKINDDPLSIIVAESGNEIIGICFNRFDDYTIWLEWILTNENYRKKGISRRLVNFLEQTAIERNCHKIWCDCRTSNSISKSFLKSVGFEFIATIENHWYKQDFILLQKKIDV
ncbi:MAG: GNAT family N-acetyltransferase [Holosporaceae bacterium]|jgi:RimJ/RimL family protein N-acetyltransferase|nr:GNAT family N-acetyltransferase [Holosporaceae bacterium]